MRIVKVVDGCGRGGAEREPRRSVLVMSKRIHDFGGVQMTSYIETARIAYHDETVNIAKETKQSGRGPVGIKDNNKRARRHKRQGP